MKRDRTQKLIQEAIDALKRETGIELRTKQQEAQRDQQRVDAIVDLDIDGQHREYFVEAKTTVNATVAGQIAQVWKTAPTKWILAAQFVNPNLAKKIRQLDIQFIDAQGNAYINDPPLYIHVNANKPQDTLLTEPGAFTRTGLKVIFALLCDRKLIGATYREIQHDTEVALGTVKVVMEYLKRQGHMVEVGDKGRRLLRKKELFDRWVTEYGQKLHPKLLLGRYRTNKEIDWLKTDLAGFQARWGGEIAAYKLTGYLQPQIITIYVRELMNDLLIKNGLRREPDGNIEVREIFWWIRDDHTLDIVHPILVYADLIATANARNVETATKIYDEQIEQYLRED